MPGDICASSSEAHGHEIIELEVACEVIESNPCLITFAALP